MTEKEERERKRKRTVTAVAFEVETLCFAKLDGHAEKKIQLTRVPVEKKCQKIVGYRES